MHPNSKLKNIFTKGFKIFTPAEILAIRTNLGKSRSEFAELFFGTRETIKGWETGRRQPSSSAIRLLQVVEAMASERMENPNNRLRMVYK
jgi:DNA-binding transcriptional regulator YiaG